MSGRRTLPSISPNDLRDHADEERIGRIWERIEHSLPGAAEAQPRRARSIGITLIAASLAMFSAGLLVGKLVWNERTSETIPSPAPGDRSVVDVWAAGSQNRTYALPGGGEIVLRPGTTVELERNDVDALTLRLVQGEAHVDAPRRSAGFAVVAGDARLASPGGSVVVVRRGANHMDVEVKTGSVSINAPGGSEQQVQAGHSQEVPLHAVTTSITPNPTRRDPRQAPNTPDHPPAPAETAAVVAAAAPAAPDWRAQAVKGNIAEARKLLREQPGGIDGAIANAKSASELTALWDVVRGKGGDPEAAFRAATQLVEKHPKDPTAVLAAQSLQKMYEKRARESGDADARAKAEHWAQRHRQLEKDLPPGLRGVDAPLCSQFRAAHAEGRKDEATKLAAEYLKTYPNAPCREDADRIAKGEDLAPYDATAKDGKSGNDKAP